MADDIKKQAVSALAQQLVRENGITEQQGLQLIAKFGMSWPTLVVNARSLKNQK